MKWSSTLLGLTLAILVACGNDSRPTRSTEPTDDLRLSPAGKAVAVRSHGSNHPPAFSISIQNRGLTLLMPRGTAAPLTFPGEPATDPEGEDVSYRFAFAVPGMTGIQTPEEALLRITREGNTFNLGPDGDISPGRFTSVYGEFANLPSFAAAIYASDGTDETGPQAFSLQLVYDGSARFSDPAQYAGDQRWEISTPLEMYEGATTPEEPPTWTAVTADFREWGFDWTPPSIRCEIVTAYHPYTFPDGGGDNSLFNLASEERATSGTVSLALKSVPDYEAPGDGDGDNEYQVRVVNTHDIHYLNNEGSPTGCSGSVLDLAIRVKDVGVPVPPGGGQGEYREEDDTKIDVSWTAPGGFSEDGRVVPFPPGFEVTDYDYRYRPAGTGDWTEVTDTDFTETEVTIADAAEDAYEIQVRATNGEGTGDWSSTMRAEKIERTVSFGESRYTTMEGDPSGVEIAVYLDPAAGVFPVSVPIMVEEGEGTGPEDYSGVPSSLTFEPEESMQTFTLVAMEDTDQDETEEEMIRLNFGDLPRNVRSGAPAMAQVVLEQQAAAPVIQGLRIISSPETGTTYGRDEVIQVEVAFDGPVTVTGPPYLRLEFNCRSTRRTYYRSGSGTESLIFEYRVRRSDWDTNGLSVRSGPVSLNGGAINAVSGGAAARLDHGGLASDPDHKVNGYLARE